MGGKWGIQGLVKGHATSASAKRGCQVEDGDNGELKKPQRATLSIPGKYDFPTIVEKLQRLCLDL